MTSKCVREAFNQTTYLCPLNVNTLPSRTAFLDQLIVYMTICEQRVTKFHVSIEK